ncbi:MAG: AI-2E family transporter [Bacteroidales bacterium]|nr:AI-2E family transporter [Bacteroidales bacterium]
METDAIKRSWAGIRFWVIAASLVIVIAGMKAMSNLILVLLMAIFMTAVSLSPFLWLKKKKVPEVLSLVIVILVIMGVLYSFSILLTVSVSGFTEKLPFYEERFSDIWLSAHRWMIDVGLVDENINIMNLIKSTNLMKSSGGAVAGLGRLISNPFLVLFVYIFMMLEVSIFGEKMRLMSPKALGGMQVIITNIRRYFGIKFLTSFATGLVIYIGLLIIGVDFPLLWGLVAFILNFIPSIGSIFAAIPAVLLAFVQLNPISGLATGILYLLSNVIIGSIIEPPLMGRNLGLSPLVVFVSLLLWGFVLGPIGMLISAPLTMILKIIFDNRPQTRSIGIILGDKSSLKVLEKEKEKDVIDYS